jgi:hypothetical protein
MPRLAQLALALAALSPAALAQPAYIRDSIKYGEDLGGFEGPFYNGEQFGAGVCVLGDLDKDGVTDIAVGVPRALGNRGALWIIYRNPDGTVKSRTRISSGESGFPEIPADTYFGCAVANLGDLDGDGAPELAVGAFSDDDPASGSGAVHILRLNPQGTVKSTLRIAHNAGGFDATLHAGDAFGYKVFALGDINNDGAPDLGVHARGDNELKGALWILLLNPDQSVLHATKIGHESGGWPLPLDQFDRFGTSAIPYMDVDANGVTDLLVGAPGREPEHTGSGEVFLFKLNPDGSLLEHHSVLRGTLYDQLGAGLARIDDINRDGLDDLVVGGDRFYFYAPREDGSWTLLCAAPGACGSINGVFQSGGAPYAEIDTGDLDSDGLIDLLAGAPNDDGADKNGSDRGAAYAIHLSNCPIDYASPHGVLDFSDISEFLIGLDRMEDHTDLARPYGVFDFSDVLFFLQLYADYCDMGPTIN